MRRLSQRYGNAVPLTELAKWVSDRDPRAKTAMTDEMGQRPVIYSRAPVLHKYGIQAGMPVLLPGNSIRISPILTKGFGADFDGDTMNIHVPSTPAAAKEAIERMLPSKNLRSPADFEVAYLPQQEYVLGLYLAAQQANKAKTPKVFATRQDAIAAYRKGELSVNDPVEIKS